MCNPGGGRMTKSSIFLIGIVSAIITVCGIFNDAGAEIIIKDFINNMEKNDKQSVLVGNIDSLNITRGNGQFLLGKGKLTLFDFGTGRVMAMVFEGNGRFVYVPPDEVERGQLQRFIKADKLEDAFPDLTIFYTIEMEGLPDTSGFKREPVDNKTFLRLLEAEDRAFDHQSIYMPNALLDDILAGGPGTYFYGFYTGVKNGRTAYIENPFSDDIYRLSLLKNVGGDKLNEIISANTPDNSLPSQRGIMPIDITHYRIDSKIEGNGDMYVKCMIRFIPMRWGRQYLHFYYLNKNIVDSVFDSRNDKLEIINHRDESGFGVALKRPLDIGAPDSITVYYKCNTLENITGIFFIRSLSYWYPQNLLDDRATYELNYDYPDDYQVIASAEHAKSSIEKSRTLANWVQDYPVSFVSFYVGHYDSLCMPPESTPNVTVYLCQNIPHKELARYLNLAAGQLSNADMMGTVKRDVVSSLDFFQSLFGPLPFKSIRANEMPFYFGQGSPGLIHYSFMTFQTEDMAGGDIQFRAHEVSHQWWGNIARTESYHDTWIIEGLAEYCGFTFFQMAFKNSKTCDNILEQWRKNIIYGSSRTGIGTKAGPICLGYRLSSSKSTDYSTLVYEKGAYIFHMIRFLLHDYKTGSDDDFAAFLKELLEQHRVKPITTKSLQTILEKYSGEKMDWFFNQWVYDTGVPSFTFGYSTQQNDQGKYLVTCHLKRDGVADNFEMLIPVTVSFEGERFAHLQIWSQKPEEDIILPALPEKPRKIEFNTYKAVLCNVEYDKAGNKK
jgi:hypothetical protein